MADFKVTDPEDISPISLDKVNSTNESKNLSLSNELLFAIEKCFQIIDNCRIHPGLPHLEIALLYLIKITEYKNIQEYLKENVPIDQIIHIFEIFQEKPIESIYYKIIDFFVNMSYFLPDFVTYFVDNGGIEILEDLISPQEIRKISKNTNHLKSILKLLQNISSYYPERFEEETILEFIQVILKMDEICKPIATNAIINFEKKYQKIKLFIFLVNFLLKHNILNVDS